MGVEVRSARSSDIDGIQRVAEVAWHAAHEPIVGADTVASFLARFYDAESFDRYLEADRPLLAVAADEGEVVGFVSARPDDESPATFQLGRIYVLPDRWGEGIGRRLLQHAESEIAVRGGERIELGVMAENERAIAFYEAAGYERVEEFYDDRIDAPGYTYTTSV